MLSVVCCSDLCHVSPELLSERVGEELYLYLRTDAFVQNVVYGVENGHVHVHVPVFLLHAFCSEEALGYHLHLYLRALDTVAFAYHGAEGAVAREV